MAKYKIGAIIKEVPKGAEKWYIKAGWNKIDDSKTISSVSGDSSTNTSISKEEKGNDQADTKKTSTT